MRLYWLYIITDKCEGFSNSIIKGLKINIARVLLIINTEV